MIEEVDGYDMRIEEIIGSDNPRLYDAVIKFYDYLLRELQFPFDVTGIEDFQWEEPYIFGAADSREYLKLRKMQPSYKDIFELLAIEKDTGSEWMMYEREDLAGRVRRKSDGKEFYLGLSEIKVIDKKSESYRLLDDYAVWFVNEYAARC